MQGEKRWRERGRGKERERKGGRGREARRKEINSRAEPIVPKTLPIILFQISTSFSLLFQHIFLLFLLLILHHGPYAYP